jgi:hypothetical protein
VQEPFPVAPADAGNHTPVVTSPWRKEQPVDPPPDTAGQLIHQESADQFQGELDQGVVEHGSGMMSLAGQVEKAGKAGRRPTWSSVQLFPPFRFEHNVLC